MRLWRYREPLLLPLPLLPLLKRKKQKKKKKQSTSVEPQTPEAPVTPTRMTKLISPAAVTETPDESPSPRGSTRTPFRIKAMVLGSSIVRHVKGANLLRHSGARTKVCCFPGAGYEKLADHADVEMKYCTPSVAILHVGGNDLANKIKPAEIVENLAFLGCELLKRGAKKIAISGMTPRRNMKSDISQLNTELVTMCRTYGYDYIDNSNIWFRHHLAYDQVHLNYDGVEFLESNYIEYLRNIEVEE